MRSADTSRPVRSFMVGPGGRNGLWLEARWLLEFTALISDPVYWGAGVTRGRGQRVLLVPGFLLGDWSMAVMAEWLRRIGYRPLRPSIALNTACPADAVETLAARIRGASAGEERVTIIGHSRGGLLAAALATSHPQLVDQVIALGSPLLDWSAIHPTMQSMVNAVAALGDRGVGGLFSSGCLDGSCCGHIAARYIDAFPEEVGFASIYSRSDGIVDWRSCLHPSAEHAEVNTSHLGMGLAPDTYRAVARILSASSSLKRP